MFNKIITFGVVAISFIAGIVLANGGSGWNAGGGHSGGITLPMPPIPTISINTGGLMALLRNPPIPIIKLPPINLPQIPGLSGVPIPMISLPISGGHHGGMQMPQLPIGDLLNAITGGNHDSWGSSWA